MLDSASSLLLVEDDQRLRYLTELVLKEHFERVFAAGGAAEAIDLFERDPTIGVVFTDVMMPGGRDGVAMAAVMRERRPEVRFLITTGNPGFKTPDWPHCAFLEKPYSKERCSQHFTGFSCKRTLCSCFRAGRRTRTGFRLCVKRTHEEVPTRRGALDLYRVITPTPDTAHGVSMESGEWEGLPLRPMKSRPTLLAA